MEGSSLVYQKADCLPIQLGTHEEPSIICLLTLHAIKMLNILSNMFRNKYLQLDNKWVKFFLFCFLELPIGTFHEGRLLEGVEKKGVLQKNFLLNM